MALIPGTLQAGTKYPNDPQSLLDLFASFLTAPEVKKNRPIVTLYIPTAGSTVNFNTATVDETVFLNHGGSITGLNIGFPSNGNSVIGQVLRIVSRAAVAATVSYSDDGAVFYGTTPQPTSFAASGVHVWQKVAASTWFKIQ